MLNHAKEINDKDVIEKLEKFDPHAESFPFIQEEGHLLDYLIVRTKIMAKYRIGHLHQQDFTFQAILKSFFAFQGYTLREKINWFLGADISLIHLMPVVMNDNLFVSSVKFEVPFYIVQGAYDYQVSTVLAEKYLEVLEAPKKEFFLFDNSAHTPNLEEMEEFVDLFRKIASENPLEN